MMAVISTTILALSAEDHEYPFVGEFQNLSQMQRHDGSIAVKLTPKKAETKGKFESLVKVDEDGGEYPNQSWLDYAAERAFGKSPSTKRLETKIERHLENKQRKSHRLGAVKHRIETYDGIIWLGPIIMGE